MVTPPFTGIVLEATRECHIVPLKQPPSPLHDGVHGMLATRSADELSAALVAQRPVRVLTQVLQYKVVAGSSLDKLEVVGIDESIGNGIASCKSAEMSPMPQEELERRRAPDGDVDLLAMLRRHHRRPRPGPSTAPGRRQHRGVELELADLCVTEAEAFRDMEERLVLEMEEVDETWPIEQDAAEEAEAEESEQEAALQSAGSEAEACVSPAASSANPPRPRPKRPRPSPHTDVHEATADEVGVEAAPALGAGEDVDVDAAADAAPAGGSCEYFGGLKCLRTHKQWHFRDVHTNDRVMTVYALAGLKAVCHKHKNCVCWISEKCLTEAAPESPLEKLARWGEDGCGQSHAQHQQAAQELKRVCGMRVRSAGAAVTQQQQQQ